MYSKDQHALVNVRHNNLEAVLNSPAVKREVNAIEEQLGQNGRLVLRKSGTEPLIRVMVEACDSNTAIALTNKLAKVIEIQP